MIYTDRKIPLLIAVIFTMILASAPYAAGKSTDQPILLKSIQDHITKNMLWRAENVRTEFLWDVPKLDDLSGKVTFNIESKQREEYIGDTSFTVRIYANGKFVREENIRVRIEVLHDFVVSLNSMAKDSIVQAEDVKVQSKWVRIIPMQTLSSLNDVLGKKLTASIRPNTPLTRSMVKNVTPVKKGKMVEVILDNGVMTMTMKGIAEEDGDEDSLVKVRNLNSNKIIYARVIGQGKVQVDF